MQTAPAEPVASAPVPPQAPPQAETPAPVAVASAAPEPAPEPAAPPSVDQGPVLPQAASYFPEAPAGWVRLSAIEAQQPQAVLAARLQQLGADPDYLPEFEAYQKAQAYVLKIRAALQKGRTLKADFARVYYIGPDWEFAEIKMSIVAPGSSFGAPDAPAAWQAHFIALLKKSIAKKNATGMVQPQAISLGQMLGVRSKLGSSPLDPLRFDLGSDEWAEIKGSFALNHRTRLSVNAQTTPERLHSLLTGIDAAAVTARLALDG